METQPKARLPNLVGLPYIMDRPTFDAHTLAIHRMGVGVSLPRWDIQSQAQHCSTINIFENYNIKKKKYIYIYISHFSVQWNEIDLESGQPKHLWD